MDWSELRKERKGGLPWLACLMVAIGLSGCSAFPRSSPLPNSGATMEDIYRGHHQVAGTAEGARLGDVRQSRSRLPLRAATEFDPGPARLNDMAQIQQGFPRVANPDLVMTVFPHLARGRYPVPGYVTVFPMYESVEYLLPGEASGNYDGLR